MTSIAIGARVPLRSWSILNRSLSRLLSTSAVRKQQEQQVDLSDELQLEYLKGDGEEGLAVLSLNRPKAKNALSKNLMGLFETVMQVIHHDRTLRAVVLRSKVPGVFCAGADLKERRLMKEADVPLYVSRARHLFHQFSELPVPTICALDGVALGGGLELALTCDFRIASSTALMGLTETKLAIIPGAGGTVRLPRLIGETRAKELIFTGRALMSREAFEYGLVSREVQQNESKDAAYQEALNLAKEIVTQGPVALRMAKKSISKGMEVDIYSALTIEETCYAQVIPTQDRLEGIASFIEKRKPVYKGE